MGNSQIIYGLHTVRAVLQRSPGRVRCVWFLEGRTDQRLQMLRTAADKAGVVHKLMSRRELDALTPDGKNQGVVADVETLRSMGDKELFEHLQSLEDPPFLLVLDGVQDPHNLGACLRSADAAGAHGVIVPKDRSAGLSSVVQKVASGAAETLPLYTVVNLARTLRKLKDVGIWIYGGADMAAGLLYECDLSGPVALVLGAEGKGLRRLTRELCDGLVSIPMSGSVESLNVSVAAGVLLFEVRRQRLCGGS